MRMQALARLAAATVAVVSLCVLVGAAVALLIARFGFESVDTAWSQVRPIMLTVKWSAMVLLVVRWPQVARWLGARYELPAARVRYLEGMRWRVAAALVALELAFGQNLLGRLLAA